MSARRNQNRRALVRSYLASLICASDWRTSNRALTEKGTLSLWLSLNIHADVCSMVSTNGGIPFRLTVSLTI